MTDARTNLATAKLRTTTLSLSMAMVVATVIAVAPAPALARDFLFLGVTDVRGEPAQPGLEGELRAEFAANRHFRLIGDIETQRILREMERQGHTRTEAVIPRSAGLADSTVIVRGVVRELSVVTKRSSLLLWGKIDARMRLEVSLSELSGQSSHRGEFGAEASKRKDVILFADPKKSVHVSVADREELLGRMRARKRRDRAGGRLLQRAFVGRGAAVQDL